MKFELPDIPKSEQTPVVKGLLNLIEQLLEHTQKQQEEIDLLKDEIRVLKGQKKRPKYKPSKLDESTDDEGDTANQEKKSKRKKSSQSRQNKKNLPIHQEVCIKPESIPEGSRFKGYQDFTVQELLFKSENTRYRLERWETPDGHLVTGKLPASLENRHYGPDLVTYVLYQHHHCQVTQPLLLEQLREWRVIISSGQLNRLLSEDKESFHTEKDQLLDVGLRESGYVTVDDSGARHQGRNGYVTHIGNEFFAWFSSTRSKSRINFLTLLNGGRCEYRLSVAAFDYMRQHKLPKTQLEKLAASPVIWFTEENTWQAYLHQLEFDNKRHQRIATEGALMGTLLEKNTLDQLAIVSDGAGQFKILQHGLCWVHAERLIHTLQPINEAHRNAVELVRNQIWAFYRALKQYKKAPSGEQAEILSVRFDEIFLQNSPFITLKRTLRRLHKHKEQLLLVLKRPDIPLHTNGSEGDIREFVKKRKISGGTRSDLGQQCRDTFASLKKTCRKLGLSFWEYLRDRHHDHLLPPLSELVRQHLAAATTL
jgi:hypothetical protein